jgi:hypothetical protein
MRHDGCGGRVDGKRDGQGTNMLPDGSKYVGEWKDDKGNGQGTITLPTGEKYVGEFKNGKRDGQGTNTWPTGQKYVGEWKDGSPTDRALSMPLAGLSFDLGYLQVRLLNSSSAHG